MGSLFDSLGVSIAFAGIVIILAGIFLTPIRGVLWRGLRRERYQSVAIPPVATPPARAATAQVSPAPAPAAQAAPPEPSPVVREQEALFARTLITAQKTAEDLVRNAQAEAQEIVEQAQASANDIAGAARRNAAEMLQKAEQEAELIIVAANQKAAARLALLQAEIQQLVVDAHQTFQTAQRSVQQNVASLTSRINLNTADGDAEAQNGDHAQAAPAPAAVPANGAAARPQSAGLTWSQASSDDAVASVRGHTGLIPPNGPRSSRIA